VVASVVSTDAFNFEVIGSPCTWRSPRRLPAARWQRPALHFRPRRTARRGARRSNLPSIHHCPAGTAWSSKLHAWAAHLPPTSQRPDGATSDPGQSPSPAALLQLPFHAIFLLVASLSLLAISDTSAGSQCELTGRPPPQNIGGKSHAASYKTPSSAAWSILLPRVA